MGPGPAPERFRNRRLDARLPWPPAPAATHSKDLGGEGPRYWIVDGSQAVDGIDEAKRRPDQAGEEVDEYSRQSPGLDHFPLG
jgi:hypothetical protein